MAVIELWFVDETIFCKEPCFSTYKSGNRRWRWSNCTFYDYRFLGLVSENQFVVTATPT